MGRELILHMELVMSLLLSAPGSSGVEDSHANLLPTLQWDSKVPQLDLVLGWGTLENVFRCAEKGSVFPEQAKR